jgi:hypothetical protein
LHSISFRVKLSKPVVLLVKGVSFLILCTWICSCGAPSGEFEKQELQLYNNVLDQVAWQSDEGCNHQNGLRGTLSSKQHGDSVKNKLRELPQKRVLLYQPRIAAPRKNVNLAEWLTVEMSSWERFYRTFGGTTPKDAASSLAVTATVDIGKLHLDYMELTQIDTASATPIETGKTVIRFSKPFYHKKNGRAVLYVETACAARASGELLMLRLKDGRWFVEERRSVWNKIE